METDEAAALVLDLYRGILRREPGEAEAGRWAAALVGGAPVAQIVKRFLETPEFKNARAVPTKFPNGHYHSPVVDPRTIAGHLERAYATTRADFPGIAVDIAAMGALWQGYESVLRAAAFTPDARPGKRYHYEGGPYPIGDAVILRLMMAAHRPRRIIEIGSGFSSACMLDCAEEFRLDPFELVCIEPYPQRLKGLLRAGDPVTIIESGVQEVPLHVFDALEADDMLFVDSTHVMKTGSDVCHEIFDILPRLPPGVVVHVHDCPFPFEYPRLWAAEENYSWNEIYALRAFLMFNARFGVYFWNSLFARSFRERIAATYSKFMINPGSAIWLRVLEADRAPMAG